MNANVRYIVEVWRLVEYVGLEKVTCKKIGRDVFSNALTASEYVQQWFAHQEMFEDGNGPDDDTVDNVVGVIASFGFDGSAETMIFQPQEGTWGLTVRKETDPDEGMQYSYRGR